MFSNFLVSFERFAACSHTLYSLSSGLLPVLKFPGSLSTSLRLVLKFSSLLRAACSLFCSLFSNSLVPVAQLAYSLVSLERFAPCSRNISRLCRVVCSLFSNSLVCFEQFVPCSQILLSLSSSLRLVLKFSSLFRAVCSFLVLQFSTLFGAVCSLSQIPQSPSSSLRLDLELYLVSVERFAPCSQIP